MNQRGFTLIEAIVSILVLSVLAGGVHYGIGTLTEMQSLAASRRDELHAAVAARDQIFDWLRSSNIAGQADARFFLGMNGVSYEGTPQDTLYFATMRAEPFHGRWAVVRMTIETRPDLLYSGLVACLWYGTRYPGRTGAETGPECSGAAVDTVMVVPGATGLEIRYLADSHGTREWLHTWDAPARAPLAIQLAVFGPDLHPIVRRPILVPLSPP